MSKHKKVKYRFHLIAPGEAYRYELRSQREAISCREAARLFAKRHGPTARLCWKLSRNTKSITIWRLRGALTLRLVA